ncbi:C40 family peptidase [Lactiplantibacillus plajomi]|uniref:LysM peptidoglycan-binding domain-containing protein n=1 Tax=Lactiplantibacillus plajomi TaxID=1457217 RepID=A0ABV6K127_9LACO|nr:C40 family peptidase [Lactiplantibacillus plajomi]
MSQAHTTGKVLAGTVGAVGLLLATGQAANAASVTVKANDTVWGLAQEHGVSVQSIEQLNKIKALDAHTDLIFVGQQLQINGSKQGTVTKTSATKTGSHTVQAGDTLWDLADQYHTSVYKLQVLNNLSGDLIVTGQSLKVPATTEAKTTTKQTTPVSSAATSSVAASAQTTNVSSTSAASAVTSSAKTSQASAQSVASQGATKTATSAATSQAPASVASSTSVTSQATSSASQDTTSTTQSSNTTVSAAADTPAVSKAPVQQTTAASSASTTQNAASSHATSQAQSSSTSAASSQVTSSSTTSTASASSSATTNTTNTVNVSDLVSSSNSASSVTTSNVATQNTSNSELTSGSVTGLALKLANANIPYVWGGASLSGMDCSGLVAYVYQHAAGISLPHNTVAQEAKVTTKSVADAQPGDILFWGARGGTYHDAIYIGNNQFVAAPQAGENVKVQTISSYFMPSFAGTVK